MTFDRNMLKAELIRSGFKIADLSEWLGLSREAVNSKMLGKTKWSREEIVSVAEHLGRENTLNIFFAENFPHLEQENI